MPPPSPDLPPAPPDKGLALRKRAPGRLWLRVAILFSLAGAALVLLELILRWSDVGYGTEFCHLQSAEGYLTDNDKFFWRYYGRKTKTRPHPFAVAAIKPKNAFRVVVLGDSPASGIPDAAYSAPRILERMLQARYPKQTIEVINAAARGVTPAILTAIAADCQRLDPDIVIVYAGSRESMDLTGGTASALNPSGAPPNSAFWQTLRGTRIGQWLETGLEMIRKDAGDPPKNDRSGASTNGPPFKLAANAAFEGELQRAMNRVSMTFPSANGLLVISTVPSNLKDCPPFASAHRSTLSATDRAHWETAYKEGASADQDGDRDRALERFTQAEKIDDQFAELHYRMARIQYAQHNYEGAAHHYRLARDLDSMALRATAPVNHLLREFAEKRKGPNTAMADAEKAFARSDLSEDGIPGEKLFYDHVHLTFDANYLLAQTWLAAIDQRVSDKYGRPGSPSVLSRDECVRALSFTRINEAHMAAAMAKMTTDFPFTGQLDYTQRVARAQKRLKLRYGNLGPTDLEMASASFREAIRTQPEDWELPYTFARLLLLSRDYAGAIAQFEMARRLLPHSISIRLGLSNALSSAGRLDDALWQLNEALALDPQSESVHNGIAAIQALRRSPSPH